MKWIRVAVAVAVAVLLASACSTDSESAAANSVTTNSATSNSVTTNSAGTVTMRTAATPDGDFCVEATDFVTDRSVTDVSQFSADFFVDIDRRLATMLDVAPSEVRGDVVAIRDGFARTDSALAGIDYDLDDAGLSEALAQVDNEAMLAATAAIEQHLIDRCGVTTAATDPQQVADIQEAFGVDRELAECLNRELGDVANIDSQELTPGLMGRSVCGTSLLALLAGAQPGG